MTSQKWCIGREDGEEDSGRLEDGDEGGGGRGDDSGGGVRLRRVRPGVSSVDAAQPRRDKGGAGEILGMVAGPSCEAGRGPLRGGIF